jgi:hypothetical protein
MKLACRHSGWRPTWSRRWNRARLGSLGLLFFAVSGCPKANPNATTGGSADRDPNPSSRGQRMSTEDMHRPTRDAPQSSGADAFCARALSDSHGLYSPSWWVDRLKAELDRPVNEVPATAQLHRTDISFDAPTSEQEKLVIQPFINLAAPVEIPAVGALAFLYYSNKNLVVPSHPQWSGVEHYILPMRTSDKCPGTAALVRWLRASAASFNDDEHQALTAERWLTGISPLTFLTGQPVELETGRVAYFQWAPPRQQSGWAPPTGEELYAALATEGEFLHLLLGRPGRADERLVTTLLTTIGFNDVASTSTGDEP